MSALEHPKVRCRQIGEADIEAIVTLLVAGFAGRTRAYWREGFERQRLRPLPTGLPRFGFMLEHDGRPVGVILLLFTRLAQAGEEQIRCNVSSWYVEPEFRTHASLLIFMATKYKGVTYINISPARHTWPTIEAQGFSRYVRGQFLSVPALRPPVAGTHIHRIGEHSTAERFASLPEHDLLREHAGWGCLSLVVEASDGLYPFVFQAFRIRAGRVRLPIRQLIYCRDAADFRRFAGPIGRFLLRHGAPFVLQDSTGPVAGLLGHFRDGMGAKFFRGPDRPRLSDLAYTERVIFGP